MICYKYRMELRHLRYFVAVAATLNFRKAADMLNMSQPPLSQQIKDLEYELGADLFIREKNRVRLSPEGVIFLDHANPFSPARARPRGRYRPRNRG